MRRFFAGIVVLGLALTCAAPLTASAIVGPPFWPLPASSGPLATNLFKEQVASQPMIGALLGTASNHGTWVTFLSFNRTSLSSTKAVFAVTTRLANGSSVDGQMVLYKYAGKWYFYSITRGGVAGISNVANPPGISNSVVSNAIVNQSTYQSLVVSIVNGGYRKLNVLSRSSNVNTRQVNIKLSGGTHAAHLGRILAYAKTASNGNRYWFISNLR